MSSKTDLMYEITYNPQFIPQRSPKVNIKTLVVDGKETYIMKNHLTGMYYDVDDVSREIWNLIDGKRTVTQIGEEILQKWPDIEPDTATEVILFFAEVGCLKAIVEQAPKKRIGVPSAFEVDFTLIRESKAFLEGIHKIFRPLLIASLFWASILFIVLCSVLFAGQFAAIFVDAEAFRILGSTVVGFFFYSFIVLGPSIAIHEIAHGLALVHYGGTPGEIGTGLFYFGPMFYIDATDSWTLSRKQRIMVMMAGNISTLLIASAIVAIGYIFPYPASISHILYMAAFFCFFATLMNMAPPFETDGYYVLADLVNVPNLRQESYGYVKAFFKKALGMHVEKEKLEVKKKKTLIGFAFLSVAWIVYTAFQTTLFTFYMAGDTQTAFLTMYSAIASSQELSLSVIAVSVASVLYFAMTLTGYGVILASAIKKAVRAPLKFEAIHDRDLSMFFFLPAETASTRKQFENYVKKTAGKFTQNYRLTHDGLVCTATLRMGGTKLALNQIGTHLREIEQSFSSMYQDFLQKHSEDLFKPVDAFGITKVELEALLTKMGSEIAETGMFEAKNTVEEIVEEQKQTSLYLLNSTYGSVWTVELSPSLLYEVEEKLLPISFVEDFAITDLYGETEEFKKYMVYGFDSLLRLSAQNYAYLRKALKNPQEYQVVSFFEPIKSRLLFVGRTERIEKDIPMFGALFVDQAFCGYLDNLLSETNLTLSTLRQPPVMSMDDFETMTDGELFVLEKNLSSLSASEEIASKALSKCEEFIEHARNNIQGLKEYFEENQPSQVESLNAVFAINAENLARLPKRVKKFKEEYQRIAASIGEVATNVQKECRKRGRTAAKKLRATLYLYPIVAIFSAMLILAGLYVGTELLLIPFFTTAALLQVAYWGVYYSRWKRIHRTGRYASRSFINMQLYVLAFTQAVYRFISTYDLVVRTKREK